MTGAWLEKVLRRCGRLKPEDSFVREILPGTYTVEGGSIAPLSLPAGQWFYVYGSTFNDGVHQAPGEGLTDETFDGAVWALAVPRGFLDLAEEMAAWQEKNGAAAAGPYSSESFGGYSYSKATDAKTGGAVTVWSTFYSQLAEWMVI